jgi:hypothetical protein
MPNYRGQELSDFPMTVNRMETMPQVTTPVPAAGGIQGEQCLLTACLYMSTTVAILHSELVCRGVQTAGPKCYGGPGTVFHWYKEEDPGHVQAAIAPRLHIVSR